MLSLNKEVQWTHTRFDYSITCRNGKNEVMRDGLEFIFKEKTEPIGAGVLAQKSNKGSAISSAFDNNIADNQKKSKQFAIDDIYESTGIDCFTINELRYLFPNCLKMQFTLTQSHRKKPKIKDSR